MTSFENCTSSYVLNTHGDATFLPAHEISIPVYVYEYCTIFSTGTRTQRLVQLGERPTDRVVVLDSVRESPKQIGNVGTCKRRRLHHGHEYGRVWTDHKEARLGKHLRFVGPFLGTGNIQSPRSSLFFRETVRNGDLERSFSNRCGNFLSKARSFLLCIHRDHDKFKAAIQCLLVVFLYLLDVILAEGTVRAAVENDNSKILWIAVQERKRFTRECGDGKSRRFFVTVDDAHDGCVDATVLLRSFGVVLGVGFCSANLRDFKSYDTRYREEVQPIKFKRNLQRSLVG